MKKYLTFFNLIWIFLAIALLFALFMFVSAVPAHALQIETPPVVPSAETSPPASTNPSLPDVAVLIAIVAFFKKRFDLKENGVVYAVLGVGAVLWFSPLLAAAFPDFGKWIDEVLAFVKWVLASMGAVDFAINTGAKILTTTKTEVK